MWLRQNNPTGKFPLSTSGKSLLGLPPSCPRGRGVGHRHRTLGWDVVDAAASCARWDGRAGFAARERSQDVLTSGAEAYGKVVWSWRLSGRRQVLRRCEKPDRADVPGSARRRRQESPILRGERGISRKAIAQGMSDRLRCPVCSCAVSFYFAHGTAGAACIRHSLLPPFWRDNETQASGAFRRENADVCLLFDI